nr:MAG: hypothetical protein J07AB56_03450 [Candidatus Nanosalinarum sp. J07AB56]
MQRKRAETEQRQITVTEEHEDHFPSIGGS